MTSKLGISVKTHYNSILQLDFNCFDDLFKVDWKTETACLSIKNHQKEPIV